MWKLRSTSCGRSPTGFTRRCSPAPAWATRWRRPAGGSRRPPSSTRTASGATRRTSSRRSTSAASRPSRTRPSTLGRTRARYSAFGRTETGSVSRCAIPGAALWYQARRLADWPTCETGSARPAGRWSSSPGSVAAPLCAARSRCRKPAGRSQKRARAGRESGYQRQEEKSMAAMASRLPASVENQPARWGSWLGVGVVFFLRSALLNVLLAVLAPLLLHLQGAAAIGSALVWSPEGDAALLGRSLKDVVAADPKLGIYLVSFMDTMPRTAATLTVSWRVWASPACGP